MCDLVKALNLEQKTQLISTFIFCLGLSPAAEEVVAIVEDIPVNEEQTIAAESEKANGLLIAKEGDETMEEETSIISAPDAIATKTIAAKLDNVGNPGHSHDYIIKYSRGEIEPICSNFRKRNPVESKSSWLLEDSSTAQTEVDGRHRSFSIFDRIISQNFSLCMGLA